VKVAAHVPMWPVPGLDQGPSSCNERAVSVHMGSPLRGSLDSRVSILLRLACSLSGACHEGRARRTFYISALCVLSKS
jgi:hypothetical protein